MLGFCVARLGDAARARQYAALLERGGFTQASFASSAMIYAGLGETRDACRALKTAFELSEPWLPFLLIHPGYDSLRDLPAFQRMQQRVFGAGATSI